jgi:hypothetical protein
MGTMDPDAGIVYLAIAYNIPVSQHGSQGGTSSARPGFGREWALFRSGVLLSGGLNLRLIVEKMTLLNKLSARPNIYLLRFYFLLGALGGALCLASLLLIPPDPKNAWFLGYSLPRLSVVALVVLGLAALLGLSIKSWVDDRWLGKWVNLLSEGLRKRYVDSFVFYLSAAGLIAGSGILLFTSLRGSAILVRLAPVALWATILTGQTLLGLYLFARFTPLPERKAWSLNRKFRLFVLFLILFAGVVIRVVAESVTDLPLEEARRQRIAANLVRGREYVFCNHYFPFCGADNETTASVEPLPVLIFAVFMAALDERAVLAILIFQMLLGVLSAYVLYRMVFHLFDDLRTAYLGAFLWATYTPLIATSELSMEAESIFTFLLMVGILALLYGLDKGRWFYWVIAGLSLGLAALSRSSLLYVTPAVVLSTFLVPWEDWRRRLTNGVLALLAFSLVLTPWVVRNWVVFDAFVPGVTLSGYNLYRHNHIIAKDDYLYYVYSPEMREAQERIIAMRPDLRGDENEAEMDQVYREEAVKIIRDHPGRYLLLSLYRFIPLWTNLDVRYGLIPDVFWHFAAAENLTLLGLAVAAVIRRRAIRPRTMLPILGLIALYTLGYMLVNARLRFVVPIMPFVIALSADQIVHLFARLSSRFGIQLAITPQGT